VDYANGTFYATLGLAGCSQDQVYDYYTSSADALHAFVEEGGTVVVCERMSEGANFVCPVGHFCPEGLINVADGRCPKGTFSNHTGLANISQCLSCTAGMYCADVGMTEPTGPCDEGYYCSGGAADPGAAVCDERTVACDTPTCEYLRAREVGESCGGICPIGSFCPEASRAPTACPPGEYCGVEGLHQVSGPCEAGYYCSSADGGASGGVARPDGSYAGRGPCPSGFFCPEGTTEPQSCPRGTFSGEERNFNVSHCTPCTAGYYCPVENMTAGNVFTCGAGYYCPPAMACTIGHSCPGNDAEPVPCSAGFYQDEIGQDTCKVCVGGFYCPGTLSASDPNGTVACPAGHYCALGSRYPEPCPRGSLAGHEGLPHCQECPERYTCQQPGTVVSSICPAGYFCEVNNSSPEPCPMGTYSNRTGLGDTSECVLCAPGKYCATIGLQAPTGECLAGYFCEAGAIESCGEVDEAIASGRRRVVLCPEGHYCIAGAKVPVPCPPGTYCTGNNSLPVPCVTGTYNMEEMQTSCKVCPAGFICSPGGVVDYANGTFYATLGLHACADPEGGMREWVTEVGSSTGTELAGSVAKDADDYIFVSGSTSSTDGAGLYDVFVAKHDRDGRQIWSKLVGTAEDDYAQGLVVDDNGAVYVGSKQASGESKVVKFDSCGEQAWSIEVGPIAADSTMY
jgi:hypothetical protein